VVHAVLDRHAPGVRIVDVTHQVPRHDIRAGALTLWRAAPWLVPGVILAVVDPGVGTERRAVAIEVAAAGAVLIGPDNGLLLPAASILGPVSAAAELHPPPPAGPGPAAPPAGPAPDAPPAGPAPDAPPAGPAPVVPIHPPGATFAGRDIFAPAAAAAARGVPVAELGRPVDPAGLIGRSVPEPVRRPDGAIDAEVLWIDRYGNAQLNLPAAASGTGPFEVRTARQQTIVARVVSSYGAIGPDRVGLVVDSYGMLSLCSPGLSAARRLQLQPGDPVRLSVSRRPSSPYPSRGR
jgi:S-adenosylmethionine hydrolase